MDIFNNLIDFLEGHKYFNNSLLNYIIAILIFASIIAVITVFIRLVLKKINLDRNVTSPFLYTFFTIFRKKLIYITYALAIYGALTYLKTPEVVTKIIDKAVLVYIALIIILSLTDIFKTYNNTSAARTGRNPIPAGIVTIIQSFIWIIGALFIFSNLGYNVSTFVTGLGIGGIAVALAAQNILGDLFNYLVILFDKPFAKGDLIQFNTSVGRVEYVGIKSTKIRSSNGELLSVSNTDLTKTIIHNFEMAEKRRQVSIIGVEYETSAEMLHKIPDILEQAVKSVPEAEFARVHFSAFNASSLDFELVYFITTNDYVEYTKGVQKVNFAILDIFAEKGINFAYPAQRVIKM